MENIDFKELEYKFYLEILSDIFEFMENELQEKLKIKYGNEYWYAIAKELSEDDSLDSVYWEIYNVLKDKINTVLKEE